MSCHAAVRRDHGSALSAEQVMTLLELAHQGDEVTFKALARCLGVVRDGGEELWARAVARAAPRRPLTGLS